MSLSYIFTRLESDLNIRTSTAIERTWALRETNRAAKYLFEREDLVFALREQYFSFDTDEPQIALPYYVGQVRAARRPAIDPANPIQLNDMGPRYHYNSWGGVSTSRIRIKHPSATAKFITKPVKLEIFIKEAQAYDITVTFVGETAAAANAAEVVTIPAGETSVTQSRLFTAIKSISKDPTDVDVYVRNPTTREEIGFIASNQTRSRYLICNVAEDCFNTIRTPTFSCFVIECLYKPVFVPFVEDTDEFQCEGYDDAIVSQILSNLTADREQKDLHVAEVNRIIRAKQTDFDTGQTKPMNFAPDAYLQRYEALFEMPFSYSRGF